MILEKRPLTTLERELCLRAPVVRRQDVPEFWWQDTEANISLWATFADEKQNDNFVWAHYLRIGKQIFCFKLLPILLTSSKITLYKMLSVEPENWHEMAKDEVIRILKDALTYKTAHGRHEAFFNF